MRSFHVKDFSTFTGKVSATLVAKGIVFRTSHWDPSEIPQHKWNILQLPFVARQRKEYVVKYSEDDENFAWFIPTDSDENLFIVQRDDVEDGTFLHITKYLLEGGETVWFTPPSGIFEVSYATKWTV